MAFDINNFLNPESKKVSKNEFKTVKISVHKLIPAADKENFYHLDSEEVETTARTIELVGLQQNSVVKPIEGTENYEIIAGHKRRLAVLKLISEGKTEYEMIPCKIEETGDDIRNELILIFTNSTQRDRTDFERMQEIRRVKELLLEYQKDNKISGKKQDIIAALLGTNKTKIGTLENIDHNLLDSFKAEFANGKISTSTANEIAGLSKDAQEALYVTYKETGSLIAKDAKEKKAAEDEQLEGQMDIEDYPEYLPEEIKADTKPAQQEQEPQNKFEGMNIPEGTTWGVDLSTQNDISVSASEDPERQQETVVTYNQPLPDRTDKKSLVINGKINPNKEFNGMAINYFISAVINSDLFGADTEFWEGWKETYDKPEYIADYIGTKTAYVVQTNETEKCEAVLIDSGMKVIRINEGQQAIIFYEELADLIDTMIYTKVIEIKTIENDLRYWSKKTLKDLELLSSYLTENELFVIQDIMINCRERARLYL